MIFRSFGRMLEDSLAAESEPHGGQAPFGIDELDAIRSDLG
jgi:hypothetical protein